LEHDKSVALSGDSARNNGVQSIKYGEFLSLQEERFYLDLSGYAVEMLLAVAVTYIHEAVFSKLKSKICSHLDMEQSSQYGCSCCCWISGLFIASTF
jgi:hypothetical protein